MDSQNQARRRHIRRRLRKGTYSGTFPVELAVLVVVLPNRSVRHAARSHTAAGLETA